MLRQSPFRNRLRFEVKTIACVAVPEAARVPETFMPIRELNLTTVPGSIVSVTPAGTTTSHVRMNGPSRAIHVVSCVMFPHSNVGPRVTRSLSIPVELSGTISGPCNPSSAMLALNEMTAPIGAVVDTVTANVTVPVLAGSRSGKLSVYVLLLPTCRQADELSVG